jgi:hypothetical protein
LGYDQVPAQGDDTIMILRVIPLLLAALILGCTRQQPPVSRKAPDFPDRLYHVYITSSLHTTLGADWADAFHRRLGGELSREQVVHQLQRIDLTASGDIQFATLKQREALMEQIANFEPETLLFVVGESEVSARTEFGVTHGSLVSLWLFTPDDEELVWGFAYAFPRGTDPVKVADEVLRTMDRDGLLRLATPEGG